MPVRKIVISTAVAAIAVLGSAAAAFAASGTDTGDHFSKPGGTAVSASLKSGTSMKLVGSIDGTPVTVTCTKFSAKGTVPSTGLSVTLTGSPTISGCSDSLTGGADTITTNATHGKWVLTENDLANDETKSEPNSTGDRASLTVPMLGASFQSVALGSACVIQIAPTKAATGSGTFNDSTTITDTKASYAVAVKSGSSCTTAATTAISATILLSTSIHDVS